MLFFTESDFTLITSHIHKWPLFCFGSVASFFLKLFLHSSPGACWAPTYLVSSSFSVISFCLFILFMGSQRVRHDWLTELNWTDAILLFTASDLASITSHIHTCVLFLVVGVALAPSLHSFWAYFSTDPQCHIGDLPTWGVHFSVFFLPFHTVHGVLKTRILKCFAIPFSSGPHAVRMWFCRFTYVNSHILCLNAQPGLWADPGGPIPGPH